MNFYHCTTLNSARKFIHFKNKKNRIRKIRLSTFDYNRCLREWVRILLSDEKLPEFFLDNFIFPRFYDENKKIYWLGNGFYCFSEQYKNQSPLYAKKNKLESIFKIEFNEPFNHFNMFTNKDELIDFFRQDELKNYLEESFTDPEQLHALSLLMELLILEIEDEYYTNPHTAAIIIELFIAATGLEFDVISNSFLVNTNELEYHNFSAIRNIDYILNLEYSTELSKQIRV